MAKTNYKWNMLYLHIFYFWRSWCVVWGHGQHGWVLGHFWAWLATSDRDRITPNKNSRANSLHWFHSIMRKPWKTGLIPPASLEFRHPVTPLVTKHSRVFTLKWILCDPACATLKYLPSFYDVLPIKYYIFYLLLYLYILLYIFSHMQLQSLISWNYGLKKQYLGG